MKAAKILLVVMIALVGIVQAQNSDKCGMIENLSDADKFNKSLKCVKNVVNPKEPKQLPAIPAKIQVVNITESECKGYKSGEGQWVSMLSEVQEVYQARQYEFGQFENRLKKLLGLKDGTAYHCLGILETTSDLLVRPEKSSPDYPFTGLGFTCDWYYGDGCRYGLTEFTLRKQAKVVRTYEIGNCSLESVLNGTCLIPFGE